MFEPGVAAELFKVDEMVEIGVAGGWWLVAGDWWLLMQMGEGGVHGP